MTAARPDTWMPIYWGDYLSDTGHLSTEQHGAYLLLIGHYWKTGRPLPDDGDQLCRIARLTPTAWKKSRDIISAFFKISDGVWRHGRIDSELAKAVAFLDKQTANGKKGGRPKNPEQNPDETQTKPTANPDYSPKITTSPSPSYSINQEIDGENGDLDFCFERWNEMAAEIGVPKVQLRTDARRAALRKRLRESGGNGGWDCVLQKIRGAPGLHGTDGGWKIDFDFVVKLSNFTKIMEGKYDGWGTGTKAKPSGLDNGFAKLASTPSR